MTASDDSIKSAFQGGDNDNDDGLSLSEATEALEKLGGSVDESTIEEACKSCGVSIDSGREMDLDEFTSVVRHLEEEGKL